MPTLRASLIRLAAQNAELRPHLLPILKDACACEGTQVARFEEGVPANPTKHMSPEDARKWWEMNEEYGDQFKEAARTDGWGPASDGRYYNVAFVRPQASNNFTGPWVVASIRGVPHSGIAVEMSEAAYNRMTQQVRRTVRDDWNEAHKIMYEMVSQLRGRRKYDPQLGVIEGVNEQMRAAGSKVALQAATVEVFLTILASLLTRYDQRMMKRPGYNTAALSLYLDGVNKITSKMKSAGLMKRDDAEALEALKIEICQHFICRGGVPELAPVRTLVKRINEWVNTSKLPRLGSFASFDFNFLVELGGTQGRYSVYWPKGRQTYNTDHRRLADDLKRMAETAARMQMAGMFPVPEVSAMPPSAQFMQDLLHELAMWSKVSVFYNARSGRWHVRKGRAATLKRDIRLKAGGVIPAGTEVTTSFVADRPSLALMHVAGRDEPVKISTIHLHAYVDGYEIPPSRKALAKMASKGVSRTPTGKVAKVGSAATDGSPTWVEVLSTKGE